MPAAFVVGDDGHRVVLQAVHQHRADEGHQGALLRHRSLNRAILDELAGAVITIHGDDLQLARDAKLLGGGSSANAAGRFHTTHAGQIRLTLQAQLSDHRRPWPNRSGRR